jgi:transposase
VRDLENAIEAQAHPLLGEGMSVRDVAEELHVSKSQAHRIKTRLEPAGGAQ